MTRRTHPANPHKAGSPEHLLYNRWKLALANSARMQQQATLHQTEAEAHRARAEHYAKALAALGAPIPGHAGPLQLAGPK